MNTSDISHPPLKNLVPYDILVGGEWDKWVEESPHFLWDKLVAGAPHLFYDKTGKPVIKHITEKLELKLEKMLKGLKVSTSDIKGVKSRFILLIGNNDKNLLDAVGAYIYCLKYIEAEGGTSPFFHSFRGRSDVYLEGILKANSIYKNSVDCVNAPPEQMKAMEGGIKERRREMRYKPAGTGYPSKMEGDLLDHIRQGRSVFLSNLKYPSSPLLEGIGERIRGIVTDWKMNNLRERGLLIASAESKEDLPKYFVEQFEVIDFEPEKQARQDTPVSTPQPQGNIFRWCAGTWEIIYDGKTIRPPDSKGLKYIHHLIHNKNKAFYSLDLINVTSSIQSEENKQVLSQRSTQVGNEELDEQLQDGIPSKQLKQSLELLIQKLESTESQEERENIQEKIDQVKERIEIIQCEGSADKARVAVYNAIDRAYMKIKKRFLRFMNI